MGLGHCARSLFWCHLGMVLILIHYLRAVFLTPLIETEEVYGASRVYSGVL